ncbi:PREDICTED: uncharacterized protein LOC101637423 [Condylura cristata]|uniref:uncharacterized protein LOC101637423 n=1 Tax=Condylura cristata TaxID=143302 RepID=UPI0006433551|nr:PREDICTED: uncharacterized protein LOC101637423 [Condylura cristata]
MVMEKPSPLLVGREFVRQYYTLLNQAPDMLHRFYGKNSSYVHGGLDSNGKPADAVYGQKEIHRKVMSQNFTNCHTKIRHVDAHATLNDGVVVQVMGLLSNNNQALRRFMQTFVLAPEVGAPGPALQPGPGPEVRGSALPRDAGEQRVTGGACVWATPWPGMDLRPQQPETVRGHREPRLAVAEAPWSCSAGRVCPVVRAGRARDAGVLAPGSMAAGGHGPVAAGRVLPRGRAAVVSHVLLVEGVPSPRSVTPRVPRVALHQGSPKASALDSARPWTRASWSP